MYKCHVCNEEQIPVRCHCEENRLNLALTAKCAELEKANAELDDLHILTTALRDENTILKNALREIQGLRPDTLKRLIANGVDVSADKAQFTIYNELVRAETIARETLEMVEIKPEAANETA